MASSFAEFSLSGTGAQAISGTPTFDEFTLWDADVGMSFNLFLLQPKAELPLGLYLGGLAGVSRAWLDGAFGDGQNRYRYGWEAGAFGRIGTDDVALVPRIAWRWSKNKLISELVTEPWVLETTVIGVEGKLGGFVPGVFVHLADSANLTVIAVTIAY
jgi:hypothetical protein